MKFVVDAQLPPSLARALREAGHDAQAVRELGLREAEDADIWDFALANQAAFPSRGSLSSDWQSGALDGNLLSNGSYEYPWEAETHSNVGAGEGPYFVWNGWIRCYANGTNSFYHTGVSPASPGNRYRCISNTLVIPAGIGITPIWSDSQNQYSLPELRGTSFMGRWGAMYAAKRNYGRVR